MAKNSHIPSFHRNRSQINNLDPPTGLFVSHNIYPFKCDFVSLDSRILSRKSTVENSFPLASTETVENVKIVQSCNGLILCTGPRDYIGSRELTIYEMRKGCFVWSVRYLVNTDDFMNPLLKGWSTWSIVWSIVLGERKEDSCLVINLSEKVVEYNLISKTLHEIYDIRSNQLDDDELIPSFVADHNVYEFIPSFASV
nr:hypothetical protein [Tanacetum cinerariifolium]